MLIITGMVFAVAFSSRAIVACAAANDSMPTFKFAQT